MASPTRIIALAALMGLAAGAVAVYVSGEPSGNMPVPTEMSAAEIDATELAACEGKGALAEAAGAAARGEVAAMLAADPPRSLSDLAFDLPDGTPTRLAQFSGKTLLINLWATWCAPCRHEMPALDALQAQMGNEYFEVVAVNVDTGGDDKPRRFLDEIGVSHLATYRDNSLGIFNDLKRRGLALGLPVTLLVDAEGCLLAHMNGPAEWASEDARRLVSSVLPDRQG